MDTMTIGYGLAVAAGGLAGYFKAGSTESLMAGVVFGGLIVLGAYLVTAGQATIGHIMIIATALVLTWVMGNRYMKSGKIMPALVVTIMSVLILLRYAYNQFLK